MTLTLDGHELTVTVDPTTDTEQVLLDGDRVSQHRTFAGTTHGFTAAGALWEVQTQSQPGASSQIVRVSRDGKVEFGPTDRD